MTSADRQRDNRPMLSVESPTNFIELLALSTRPVDVDLPDTVILKAGNIQYWLVYNPTERRLVQKPVKGTTLYDYFISQIDVDHEESLIKDSLYSLGEYIRNRPEVIGD